MSVCEFLSDVVLQDFPSEVFLQRPNIVKVIEQLDCLIRILCSFVAAVADIYYYSGNVILEHEILSLSDFGQLN